MFLKLFRKEDPSENTKISLFQEKKMEKILEAGRLAPSPRNVEPWHFIAVAEKEKTKALYEGL